MILYGRTIKQCMTIFRMMQCEIVNVDSSLEILRWQVFIN
jgi:hypothetical protein